MLSGLYRQTALPRAEQPAPRAPRAEWLQGFEQKLAGLAELLLLALGEWQLLGRQLPAETEHLLRALEQHLQRFGRADKAELAAEHDALLGVFCGWADAAAALSDPNFALRPLRALLADCGQRSAPPSDALREEMLELRRLPIANLVADQQEIRAYAALAQLGRLMSWLRLAAPRQFFAAIQVAPPALVAAAATALTLETPSFALAAARLDAAWPGVGCWALAELLRSIYLSMLPPRAEAQQQQAQQQQQLDSALDQTATSALPEVKQRLAELGRAQGEQVWASFGEQALLRYGGYTWLLALLGAPLLAVSLAPRLQFDGGRFAPAAAEPPLGAPSCASLLRQLLLLLNAAQDGSALQAKNAEIQQAIATLSVERQTEAALLGQRQRLLNRRWCELVPIE